MKKITATLISAALLLSTPIFAARVDQRQKEQQERIAQGIANGTLTAAEAQRLEKQQAALQAEKHDMRVDNGGNLTNKEKAQLNRQQNRLSRNIYRTKHDGPHK